MGGIGEETRVEGFGVGGGDDGLFVVRHGAEEVGAPGGIELGEDIVEEEDRLALGALAHQLGLSELEGEGGEAVLATGAEGGEVGAVDG